MDESPQDERVSELSHKLEKSLCVDTDGRMESYHRFICDGKDAARQGDMHKALHCFKLANNLHQSDKLEMRIKKIEDFIALSNSEDEDEEFVNVNDSGLMLFKDLHDKLYDYQRDGVAFLYSLHRDGRKGGILADDMGLGKTVQVISFLSGMYDNELVKHALLVMPTSLITNWTKEFAKWTPGMRVKEFHGISKGERTRNLEKVQRRSGVIITTYSMLINNWQQLSSYQGREFTWDYMILDEAHKIKTATTKTAKSASAIPSKNRVLLTGTPVQNNLREMWALFDFACQGALLGTAKTFKAEYENPITRAREKDATPGEKALGFRMSENLMTIIKPYFLRRTKAEVQKQNGTRPDPEGAAATGSRVAGEGRDCGAAMPTLTRKNDLIVWTYLSAAQEDIYRQFISLDHIKELLLTTRSPLAELNILKKLCDHPRLLSAGAIARLGLEESSAEHQHHGNEEADAHGVANVPDDTLISESGKMVFLFALLEKLRQEGHRTLVFAHYRKVLDIIQRILGNRGFRVLRLDGTITQIAERQRLITLFQSDERYSVFLLTTQVGGVGITLTAANRVVIYDPSWNPATDAQAVDRAYRIGQTENVIIYRLITCGTVEEKIYRRQVFKDSLIRQNTGDKKDPFRYFSKQELKELFTLEDTRSSSTQLQLQALHSRHRQTDPELDRHIAHLYAMEMFGISDHDLMFSLDIQHEEPVEDQQEQHYIQGRVQKAQELMKAESELQMQLVENMASSTEPAWLRQPRGDNARERSHEKTPRDPRLSPPQPDSNVNGSSVLLELDHSGPGPEDAQQTPSNQVIDLTADQSVIEEPAAEESQDVVSEQDLNPLRRPSIQEDKSGMDSADASPQELLLDASSGEASIQELMEQSAALENSLLYITAADENQQLGARPTEGDESDLVLGPAHISPLQDKRLSVPLTDVSSRVSGGLESFQGNFNLQLEDSDASSDPGQDSPDTEAEERRLLSQLQLDGSLNVDKSLSERRPGRSLNNGHFPEGDETVDESFVSTKKKKRAAVIYDSDEELEQRPLENSFQLLGASTPKAAPSGSTPLRSRKSVGGNTSTASRRSLLLSIIEDTETHNQDGPDEKEEDDFIDSCHDMLRLEETTGETLNTDGEDEEEEEDEEDEDDEVDEDDEDDVDEDSESADILSKSGEETSSSLDQSTGELELASSERMDPCSLQTDAVASEAQSYDWLVERGRECYSRGRVVDALSFFLRAIDIKPGDPEIQLMTIQLYRKLSQN